MWHVPQRTNDIANARFGPGFRTSECSIWTLGRWTWRFDRQWLEAAEAPSLAFPSKERPLKVAPRYLREDSHDATAGTLNPVQTLCRDVSLHN